MILTCLEPLVQSRYSLPHHLHATSGVCSCHVHETVRACPPNSTPFLATLVGTTPTLFPLLAFQLDLHSTPDGYGGPWTVDLDLDLWRSETRVQGIQACQIHSHAYIAMDSAC